MFVEHPVINSNIKGNAKLWRYMDFAKLVSLINNHSLYLCRSDMFKDIFEGKIIGFKVDDMRESLERIASNEYIFEDETIKFEGKDKQDLLEKAEEFTEQIYSDSEYQRKNTFINCWHLNEYESAAMWDLYLKSDEGVAIQTTFDRLKNSINGCEQEIYIGKVNYIDFTRESNFFGNVFEPFFSKRISFAHEQEVRLLYAGHHDAKPLKDEDIYGVNIKVDLSELVESIYVSPDASQWFVEIVEAVIKKFNINANIIHSDLYKVK
ncbi:DUF2971 domain-containing protein [Sporosarcina sp. ACRSM]|uniref:DUF2971 domain-containing protein n=1 Tax=Sporosarcina sp. ACRSM TaxID=2918216 RepID=UPI001EF5DDF9|nr:DUF2971 domain-containing protein [Sporosarcina sp. ACRSM]MCG7337163.1 DUF2971 domain-containing protein [Sporosarcina sp. ACRSM]